MDGPTPVTPRPALTLQQAADLTQKLYGRTVAEISNLPSHADQNFLIVDKEDTKYILKIINSEESKNTTLLELQTLVLSFVRQNGIPAQTALPNTAGQLMSMEEIDCGCGAQTFCVRLLNYIPGKTIAESELTEQDLYHVGRTAATLSKTLQELLFPNLDVLQREDCIWSLDNVALMEGNLSVLDGDPMQDVVEAVIGQFKSCVLSKISSFRKGVIHGDLNEGNIVVTPVDGGRHEVSGILDWALIMNGFCVFEVAIAMAYLMLDKPSRVDAVGALLAGWESLMPLSEDERDSLFLLVLGRLCLSLVNGLNQAKANPDHKYLLTTARGRIPLILNLWELGKQEVERKWFSVASTFSVNDKKLKESINR